MRAQSQLDSWARHSVDATTPSFDPQRRPNSTHCARLSLEGLDLSGCFPAAQAHGAQQPSLSAAQHMLEAQGLRTHHERSEPASASGVPVGSAPQLQGVPPPGGPPRASGTGEPSKASVPRSGSSADSSLPLSSPHDQSEDGSGALGRGRRGAPLPHRASAGAGDCVPHGGFGPGVVQLAGIASEEDGSELGDARASCSSLQLPITLDGDGLFDKPSVNASTLTSLRSSNTSVSAVKLKHSASGLPTVFGAVPGGALPPGALVSPGGQLRHAPPQPAAAGDNHHMAAASMELAALALSQLTTQLSLDGSGLPPLGLPQLSTSPAGAGMEAAIRQAQQADQMIAQLSAMRSQVMRCPRQAVWSGLRTSRRHTTHARLTARAAAVHFHSAQALMAYHAAMQQQPPGPAAGAHGFMSSRPSLMGTSPMLPQPPSPAVGTPRSLAAAAPAHSTDVSSGLKAMLAASGLSTGQLDLHSLSALVSLQQQQQQQQQQHRG